MSVSNLILLVPYTLMTVAGIMTLYRFKKVNPVFWFLIFQWIMATGTFLALDLQLVADQVYAWMYYLSLVSFLLGVELYWKAFPVRSVYRSFWEKPVEIDSHAVLVRISVIVALSIVVTILYFRAVGLNFFSSIILGGIIEDYSSARLNAYSGEQYFAPGYANQFKNVLLPVGVSVLGISALFLRKTKTHKLILIFGIPMVLYGLLGTGQRAFLVYAFLAFLFGLSTVMQLGKKMKYFSVIAVFVLFASFTFLYKGLGNVDAGQALTATVSSIFARVFSEQQSGGLVGFRYVYSLNIVGFTDWARDLAGLLPGVKGSTLPHDISRILYGNARGTVPLSIVGSAYYNGGFVGVIIYYFLMGWVYSALFFRFLRGRRTITRGVVYGALFFYLSIHVSGSPTTLINNGVVALLILLFVRKVVFFKTPGRRQTYRLRQQPKIET